MNFKLTVISKFESVDGDAVTIRFENGDETTIRSEAEGDLNALIPGAQYTLAFIPMVKASDPVADGAAATLAQTATEPVPADHPLVLNPSNVAYNVSPADLSDVILPQEVPCEEAPAEQVTEQVEAVPEAEATVAPEDPPAVE